MAKQKKTGSTRLSRFLSRLNDQAAREATIRYQNGEISENKLAEILHPYLHRCIQVKWHGFRSLEGRYEPCDFTADLWDLYKSYAIPNYDKTQPFSPLILRLAWRVLLEAAKESKNIPLLHSDVSEVDGSSTHEEELDRRAYNDGNYHELDISEMDARAAQLKIYEKLQKKVAMNGERKYDSFAATCHVRAATEICDTNAEEGREMISPNLTVIPGFDFNVPDPMPGEALSAKKPSTTTGMGKKGSKTMQRRYGKFKEFGDMYDDLHARYGVTQGEVAAALGMGVPRLTSILYVKLRNFPEDGTLENMRKYYDSEMECRVGERQFEGKTMTQILKEWAAEANINYNNDQELAIMCGCSVSAISRYKSGDSKARNQGELMRMRARVVDFIARKQRQLQQM